MIKAFCIGNGESRKPLDLNMFRPHGKIYGCNALYRDFTPDVLTAVDDGMMHEIYQSGYCDKNETWFRNWTRIPGMAYESLVYGSMSDTDKEILNKHKSSKQENDRGDKQEFVFHGSNLSGLAKIIQSGKAKGKTKEVINAFTGVKARLISESITSSVEGEMSISLTYKSYETLHNPVI